MLRGVEGRWEGALRGVKGRVLAWVCVGWGVEGQGGTLRGVEGC